MINYIKGSKDRRGKDIEHLDIEGARDELTTTPDLPLLHLHIKHLILLSKDHSFLKSDDFIQDFTVKIS